MHNPVYAATHKGPLGAGQSAAQLIYDDEHTPWVVKSIASLQGGVNGQLTLFNDYVATRIAEELGLPVARVASVTIDNEFLDAFPILRQPSHGSFTRGFHFASQHMQGMPLSTLYSNYANALRNKPDLFSSRLTNRSEANAIAVFDSWTHNADRAVNIPGHFGENLGNLFLESQGQKALRIVMIDQGLAFGGYWHNDSAVNDHCRIGNWPLMILGCMNFFFENKMLDQFECERWCDIITTVNLKTLTDIIDEVPTAWRRDIDNNTATALSMSLLQRAVSLKALFASGYPIIHGDAVRRGVAVI